MWRWNDLGDSPRALAIALYLAAVGLAPIAVAPVDGAELSRREELRQLRGEIGRLEAALGDLETERGQLGRELERVALELELQGKRWREAENRSFLAEQALIATQAEVDRLEAEVARSERALGARLSTLYRVGRNGYLRMLLSIGSRDRLLPGVRTLRYLARRDAESLERYRASRRSLELERAALAERQAERRLAQRAEETRWRKLVELEERLGRQATGLDRRRSSVAERRDDLRDRAARLNDLLEYLAGTGRADLGGRPMQEFVGTLDWPVSGVVRHGFGPRLDPRYGTRVPHNGVELELPERSAIAAVFPGEVLFAAELDGYGRTVVLRHPGRVFSLYAGLDELRVERANMVSLGQTVGLANERLYLEIRVESRPEDPVPWFR